MKPMKEKIQTKIISMASILLDDILVPDQDEQEGNQTIEASLYDKKGNRFTFNLSLTVVPKVKDEDPAEETPLTLAEQISTILEKVTGLEADVETLKSYHSEDAPSESSSTENTDTQSSGEGANTDGEPTD